MTPSSEISRIILEVTLMKEKQKPSYQVLHTCLDPMGRKNHFVSPVLHLGSLWTGSVFRRESWPGRQGLGLRHQPPGLACEQAKLRAGRDVHTCDGTGGCHDRKSEQKEFHAGSCSGDRVPSDCPIWQTDRILLIAALSQCLVRAASKMGATVTCGNWVPEVSPPCDRGAEFKVDWATD